MINNVIWFYEQFAVRDGVVEATVVVSSAAVEEEFWSTQRDLTAEKPPVMGLAEVPLPREVPDRES